MGRGIASRSPKRNARKDAIEGETIDILTVTLSPYPAKTACPVLSPSFKNMSAGQNGLVALQSVLGELLAQKVHLRIQIRGDTLKPEVTLCKPVVQRETWHAVIEGWKKS